jgi:leucyl aminopeptidase
MSHSAKSPVAFEVSAFGAERGQDVVVFVNDALLPDAEAVKLLGDVLVARIEKAAKIVDFKGKKHSSLTLLSPEGVDAERVFVIGLGKADERNKVEPLKLGGILMGLLSSERSVSVITAVPDAPFDEDAIAEVALGMRLRAYTFDSYKTTKKDDDKPKGTTHITLHVADTAAMKKALKRREAIAEGVEMARTLVNEPPNVLYPEAFAERASALSKLGVEIEVLDEKALKKIGMRALLAVGQGSHFESRVVVMRWNGGEKGVAPVAIVGKGVTFDTGGISIKPAEKMEDMKGDMAGAACVVGLMHSLAARKAKANVLGIIGLVENMPDGKAQRPGDIVTSLSGQTIEIINTDAEGRLVLGDLLTYVQDQYQPTQMINLATLTGAILVALGQEHAGLFSNNDALCDAITTAGKTTGETVWRMPMGETYDKIIDSKFADMKNSGGRYAGSITAAQFLHRFVKDDRPWAHLDIAGVGMASPESDICKSWGSGWGVRLLNEWVDGL